VDVTRTVAVDVVLAEIVGTAVPVCETVAQMASPAEMAAMLGHRISTECLRQPTSQREVSLETQGDEADTNIPET